MAPFCSAVDVIGQRVRPEALVIYFFSSALWGARFGSLQTPTPPPGVFTPLHPRLQDPLAIQRIGSNGVSLFLCGTLKIGEAIWS